MHQLFKLYADSPDSYRDTVGRKVFTLRAIPPKQELQVAMLPVFSAIFSVSPAVWCSAEISTVAKVIRIGAEPNFDIPWQTGDVALVDDFLLTHARQPFEG